jgi:sugar lactone lactonase YvrE
VSQAARTPGESLSGDAAAISAKPLGGEAAETLDLPVSGESTDTFDRLVSGDSAAVQALSAFTVASATTAPERSLPPLITPGRLGPFVPEAVAVDVFGHVFVLDRGAGRIVRFDPGGAITAFGAADQVAGRSPILTGIFARGGPDLYAIDDTEGTLYRFDLDGRLRATVVYAEGLRDAGLAPGRAADFALSSSGDLYILDRIGGRLLLFDREGRFVTDLFAGLAGPGRPRTPARLAVTDDGAIFVLDTAGCRVRRFSREGVLLGDWAGLEPGETQAEPPGLLAVIGGGRVVLVSRGQGRVWVRDAAGRLLAEDLLSPAPRSPLSDVEAVGDTLLLLTSPGGGEVLRRRISALDHAKTRLPR